jgi:hypothetical protein
MLLLRCFYSHSVSYLVVPKIAMWKFLGVTMNNTLSWNNHIDLLMKKLSKACCIIRNTKTYMSASSLKVVCYAFFHSVMSYGITFWGSLSHSSIIFRIHKKGI